jgi:FKBP-type peptidyl-prolyl cis-trans isomerase FklB
MKSSFLFTFFLIVSFACSKVEPRRPINPKPSSTILKETAKEYKALKDIEERKILKLIKNDSLTNYIQSQNGFWYTYNKKIDRDSSTPKQGDIVKFDYNIQDLNGNVIYSEKELGTKTYKVDKEDFITAIQKGIKLMKEGETITFVIPFYNAFGIAGDLNKIGINTSIKSKVTLIQNILNTYFQKKQQAEMAKKIEKSEENRKAGEAFLAENKTKEGVKTTESGLQYVVLKEGTGKKPTKDDKVKVHYHGTVIDGTVFDSSVDRGEPSTFGVSQVIKGWTEGLQLMKEGAKYKFFIPSNLAYGSQQRGEVIQGNSTLIFEVELLEVLK